MSDKKIIEEENECEKKIVVKGYLRPDGTSYYVVIPKEVRETLNLKGGELFLMKVKPEKRKISLKLIELTDDEDEE